MSLKEGLIIYQDVKIIRIKSKKYALTIMQDYLPIMGEIDGNVELEFIEKTENIENIIAYYVHEHNQFKLFIKEKE